MPALNLFRENSDDVDFYYALPRSSHQETRNDSNWSTQVQFCSVGEGHNGVVAAKSWLFSAPTQK